MDNLKKKSLKKNYQLSLKNQSVNIQNEPNVTRAPFNIRTGLTGQRFSSRGRRGERPHATHLEVALRILPQPVPRNRQSKISLEFFFVVLEQPLVLALRRQHSAVDPLPGDLFPVGQLESAEVGAEVGGFVLRPSSQRSEDKKLFIFRSTKISIFVTEGYGEIVKILDDVYYAKKMGLGVASFAAEGAAVSAPYDRASR